MAEHFKRGYEAEWLDKTFAKAIFLGNGLVSIVSGLLANYLVTDMSLGPVAPFDAAAFFLAVGGIVIFFTWSENKGDGSDNTTVQQGMRQAYEAIRTTSVFSISAPCSRCLRRPCTPSSSSGPWRSGLTARTSRTV